MTRHISTPVRWVVMGVLAALSPGAAGAATLYGLVDTGELFSSSNGGASWSIRATLPTRDAVAVIAGGAGALFLATETGSVYRSADGGSNWTAVGTPAASDVSTLVLQSDRLLLFTRGGSVLTSLDSGVSFSATGTIAAADVVSAATIGTQVFALTEAGDLYRSGDHGGTWIATASLPTTAAVELVAFGAGLYALTSSGEVARSQSPWASWTFIGTLAASSMTSLLAAGNELVASTESGEVAASADGITWTWRGAMGQGMVRSLGSDIPNLTAVDPVEFRDVHFFLPWPNPAGERVELTFDLVERTSLTVEVFDVSGRLVARPLAQEAMPAGRTRRAWNTGSLQSGTYYVRARTPGWREERRMVLLRGH